MIAKRPMPVTCVMCELDSPPGPVCGHCGASRMFRYPPAKKIVTGTVTVDYNEP